MRRVRCSVSSNLLCLAGQASSRLSASQLAGVWLMQQNANAKPPPGRIGSDGRRARYLIGLYPSRCAKQGAKNYAESISNDWKRWWSWRVVAINAYWRARAVCFVPEPTRHVLDLASLGEKKMFLRSQVTERQEFSQTIASEGRCRNCWSVLP